MRIPRLYKGGTGILKIGKALGVGTALMQRILMEQPRCYDEIEESRHDQDQTARNERDDRRDVGDRQKVHLKALRDSNKGKSVRVRRGSMRSG
jgi:hypothetical protein